ncbi:cellulose biosynthesis protein BcsN [Methylocystis parvus]|uniref:cellulose biosynthesis protein BcsN n=1 Tax=Methylocystis parvus TaxID=134 RepID=UPI003C743AF1
MTRSNGLPSLSRRMAAALCAAFSLGLAACGQSQPERTFATDPNAAVTGQFVAGQTLSAPITSADLKDDTANFSVLTLPPEAVRNGRVTEKQFINGWRQSMSLDKAKEGGDWNDLSVEVQSAPPGGARGELVMAKPTQDSIRREILARFQGTPMRIVNRPLFNALGPYGLAIGAGAGGLRCAFAWQWVDNFGAGGRGEKSGFFSNGDMPASIRMRLCRRGVTADELASWYEHLGVSEQNLARIADSMRRNMAIQGIEGQTGLMGGSLMGGPASAPGGSLGPVVTAEPGGGRVRASVDSLEGSLFGGAAERDEIAPAPRPAKRAVRRAARKAPPAEPAAETEAPAPAPAQAPTPSVPSDGRRYLGPVSDAGGGSGQYAASAPAGRGAGFGTAIDGLPAQALRGPRAITPY